MKLEQKDTSERQNGISDQPPPTCPTLNSALKPLNAAIRELEQAARRPGDVDDLLSVITSVLWQLQKIEPEIEAARENAENIRTWGQEWKDKAKDLLTPNLIQGSKL